MIAASIRLVTQLRRRRKTSFANTKARPPQARGRHATRIVIPIIAPQPLDGRGGVDDMNDIDAPIKMRGYEQRQPPRGGGLVLDQQQFHGEAAITIVVRHLLPPIGPVVTVVPPPNASLMRTRI